MSHDTVLLGCNHPHYCPHWRRTMACTEVAAQLMEHPGCDAAAPLDRDSYMTPVEAVVEYKPGQGIWTTTWSDPDRKIRPELAEKVDELFARGLTDVQIALDLGIQPETLRIVRRSLQLYRDPKASSGRRGWPAGKPRAFDAPAVGRHTVLLRQEDMDRIERLRAREGGAMSLSKLVHRALAALEGKARKKATP